jgi:hypothetical protein
MELRRGVEVLTIPVADEEIELRRSEDKAIEREESCARRRGENAEFGVEPEEVEDGVRGDEVEEEMVEED